MIAVEARWRATDADLQDGKKRGADAEKKRSAPRHAKDQRVLRSGLLQLSNSFLRKAPGSGG